VNPENNLATYESYLGANRRPYGHLVIDHAQDTNTLLRYRTDNFPREEIVVYAPVEHDTDTVLASHFSSSPGHFASFTKENSR
jgi:hypothetical protein